MYRSNPYRSNTYRRTYSSRSKPQQPASLALASLLLLFFGLGLVLLPGGPSTVNAARGSASRQEISDRVARQMDALIQQKLSWTPAQQKIDSQLIYENKKQNKQPIAEGVDTLDTGIELDKQGKVLVDIKVSSAKLVRRVLARLGAEVTSFFPKDIRARVPLSAIEDLAANSDVIYIMPAATYMTNVTNVSEGDTTHGAALARSIFTTANGNGVKVGVLSDGVDSLAALQGTGDLPAVTVLAGQAGSGNEGAAMLEIVHDLAPNAQLFFATAGSGVVQFAQNIRDLRTAGCDIIIDDFTYFAETPFQNGQAASVTSPTNAGVVIEAVNAVTASGALYFSSAANSGNLDDGTAGVWEGDYVDGGAAPAPISGLGNLHNFGGQTFDVLTGGTKTIDLKWSDPLGGSSNDYDLYLLSADGSTLLASSQNVQNGTQDPFEQISSMSGFATNTRVVILKFSGAGRFLHLNTNRGRLSIGTSGVTFGHNSCLNGFSVAAVPAHNPFSTGNPAGPFPGLFTSSQLSELFTSDGPRRIFFNADSSAITPGDFSSTGGQLLQKPDISAADGVMCAAPGFNPFFGTSAAAPHAGAIAALIKSFNPALTPAQIRTILITTAIDIEGAGWDRDTGFGIVMANQALNSLCSIICPANVTQSNDPNQCGAVVTYAAPTTTGGSCGVVTCNPPSGSFFPVGATTVTCVTAAGPACSFIVTVQDTQPPTITCPANQTAVTNQNVCPPPTCQTVNFPPPTASDNCPGVNVVCNPPSGSCFPTGVTSVTCTATDASGNTSSCSFTVTTFDTALQDDSNPSTILLWNSLSGQYRFCCSGTTYSGVGTSLVKGCIFTLTDNPADRRVLGRVDKSVHSGTASIQTPPGAIRCTISDRNTLNDVNPTSCQ
jgi:hypothetical protein